MLFYANTLVYMTPARIVKYTFNCIFMLSVLFTIVNEYCAKSAN